MAIFGHKSVIVAVFETVSQCSDSRFGASVKDIANFSHLSFGTAQTAHPIPTLKLNAMTYSCARKFEIKQSICDVE